MLIAEWPVLLCRYAYYLAASLGVKIGQPIKKSITILQMVQFALLNAQVRHQRC